MYYTERLMLRAVDLEADEAIFTQWLNDEAIVWALRLDVAMPRPREKVKEFLHKAATREEQFPYLIICERPPPGEAPDSLAVHENLFIKDGKPRYPLIGSLNFHTQRSPTSRSTKLGIAFTKQSRGRGYGTEVLNWAADFAFNRLNLHKLELDCAADNAAAVRCYEKVGFVLEGRSREAYIQDGKWKDTLSMGYLQSEWQERRRQNAS